MGKRPEVIATRFLEAMAPRCRLHVKHPRHEGAAITTSLPEGWKPANRERTNTKHGLISQTNPLTKDQKAVLDAVKLKSPKRYLEIPTPTKT